MKRSQQRTRTVTRYYLWLNGRAWRLTRNLHTGIVSGEICFPNFANSRQQLMGATASQAGHRRTVQVRPFTYLFDKDGRLNLTDQADAIQDIGGAKRSHGNVVDVQNLLAARQWRNDHHWALPPEAIRQVEADLLLEKRSSEFRAAPILRAPQPP